MKPLQVDREPDDGPFAGRLRLAAALDPLRWTEHKGRRTRRSFTEDYKAGAIRLVLDEGKTVAAAMHEAGLVTDPTIAPRAELARVERAIENLTQPVAEGGDWPSRVGKL